MPLTSLAPSPDMMAPPTQLPIVEPPMSEEDQKTHDEIFKWDTAKPFLVELRDSFKPTIVVAQANRERRKINIDIEEERKAGRIKNSDTLVPMRVIDEAIAREKPGFVAYLQQSRRLAVFVDVQEPNTKHDDLESAFTRGMQYQDWINAHYKVIDGAQLHGWDWYEVLYDATKPLHVGIENVGHDRLYFPVDCEDIQNCTRIMREYKLSKAQLNVFVKKYGFNKTEVDKVLASNNNKDVASGISKDRTYSIFKCYCKYDEVVYVSWLAFESTSDWLKAPAKFYNGVDRQVTVMVEQPPAPMVNPMTGEMEMIPQPPVSTEEWQSVDETLYPVVPLFYEDTEQKEISSKKGRAFKDKFKQEVMTTGWSSFLNGHNRATWLIPSKNEQDGKPISEFESIEIADSKPIPFKVEWLRMPYPDSSMLNALQAFDSKIATSSGQMTYAVQSKSSGARTTATEVESAKEDTGLLTSVNITLFSGTIRKVYNISWNIVQSQALQNKIDFYGKIVEVPAPSMDMEPDWRFENDVEAISRKYDIRPAGDTDVIKRQELVQKMMQYWGVVQNTPIAMPFLAYMLKLEFAEQGELWAKLLEAGDPMVLLQQMYMVLQGIIANPAELTTLPLQGQANLAQLMQATEQMIQTRNQINGPKQPSNSSSGTNQRLPEGTNTNKPGSSTMVTDAPNTSGA